MSLRTEAFPQGIPESGPADFQEVFSGAVDYAAAEGVRDVWFSIDWVRFMGIARVNYMGLRELPTIGKVAWLVNLHGAIGHAEPPGGEANSTPLRNLSPELYDRLNEGDNTVLVPQPSAPVERTIRMRVADLSGPGDRVYEFASSSKEEHDGTHVVNSQIFLPREDGPSAQIEKDRRIDEGEEISNTLFYDGFSVDYKGAERWITSGSRLTATSLKGMELFIKGLRTGKKLDAKAAADYLEDSALYLRLLEPKLDVPF